MNDTDFNYSSFVRSFHQDLLVVIYNQTEKDGIFLKKLQKKNKDHKIPIISCSRSFHVCSNSQIVHDDQSNLNPERSMVLPTWLVVDEQHTITNSQEKGSMSIQYIALCDIIQSLVQQNLLFTQYYIHTNKCQSYNHSGSSSSLSFTFDLKHPFGFLAKEKLRLENLFHTIKIFPTFSRFGGNWSHQGIRETGRNRMDLI